MPPPFVADYVYAYFPIAYPQGTYVYYIPMDETFCGASGCYNTYTNAEIGPQINLVFGNYYQANTNGNLSYDYYSSTTLPPDTVPFTPYIMFVSVHNATDIDPQGNWGIMISKPGNYGTSSAPFWRLGGANIRILNIPGVTSAYLTNIIAQEIGHTYALGDCYGCQTYSTIMLSANTFLTDASATPQPCDLQQIHQTAYPPY
jgi:hypothetical protein